MLTATQVTTPVGRIDLATIWPGTDADTARGYVGEYLAQGYSQAGATADDAATQWAYYRAFDGLYLRLSARPATAEAKDEGSRTYTQAQIDAWGVLAAEALDAYNDLVAESEGEDANAYGVITSLR